MRQDSIFFVCDFGSTLGFGHLSRMSALATSAKKKGYKTVLVSNSNLKAIPQDFRSAFSQQIPQFKIQEENLKPNIIFIDNYEISSKQLFELKEIFPKTQLVLIDDGFRPKIQGADAVINPNLNADNTYSNISKSFLGTEYLLLRPDFAKKPQIRKTNQVVVLSGGTDAYNISASLLTFLSSITSIRFHPILIGGASDPNSELEIQSLLEKFQKSDRRSLLSASELSQLFNESEFGITTCSTSAYEMACCGLPFIGIEVSDNQSLFSKAIQKQWNLPVIKKNELSLETFAKALSALKQTTNKTSIQIDSNGPNRILDELLHSPESP